MATYPKVFTRPAAIVFSTTSTMGSNGYNSGTDIILTDHGRQDVGISKERIETAGRMVDGTYRTHYVTEKATISLGWADVPSRKGDGATKTWTADGYEGGLAILNYVENKSTPFYIKLTYDNLVSGTAPVTYPEESFRVMVQAVDYTLKQRSGKFDMMDLEIVLVEV